MQLLDSGCSVKIDRLVFDKFRPAFARYFPQVLLGGHWPMHWMRFEYSRAPIESRCTVPDVVLKSQELLAEVVPDNLHGGVDVLVVCETHSLELGGHLILEDAQLRTVLLDVIPQVLLLLFVRN